MKRGPRGRRFTFSRTSMLLMPRRAVMATLCAALTMACGAEEKAKETAVAAAPVIALPPFQQEIASVKAEVTLPGSWKYGYRLIDRPDTTFGGHQAIEFHYSADSAAGVPPRLLMVIRAFEKANWEKVRESQKNISRVLVTQGDEVYTFSIVTKSPYPVGSASTLRVDAMMLDLVGETSPFKMRFTGGAAR